MSISLSNTTPAAPSGSQLVQFQTDGSGRVSGYVPVSAVKLPGVDSTGNTANIAATNLLASPNNGLYRISAYIVVTVVDPTSSTLPSITLTWDDQDNGQPQSLTLTPTNAGNLLTTLQEATAVLSTGTGAAIQYSTTGYASNTPATMTYAVHFRVEAL